MKEYDIAVIGGGPAGMMAAIAAGKTSKVILLEKNPDLGSKLLLTGGGRCNITNNKPIKKLLNSFDNKNFLKHSFFTLTNEKLLSIFEDRGLGFIEEDDNRIFPDTEKSSDVLKVLKDCLDDVVISYNYEVKSIRDNFIINDEIKADRIIIATGGVTYPQTGCSPNNYFLTSQPITDIKYGLVPLITKKDLSDIAGITLYDVTVGYKKIKVKGNVLISHVGLTGPGIINLSNEISKDLSYDILESKEVEFDERIAIDLCPDFTHDELKEKFTKDFQDKGKTINLDGETQLSRINKKSKNRLIENLKRFPFEVVSFNDRLAKVTIGGVDLSNINPKTMESTSIPNLYFAGEILDLHGPTGGYNLKIAFSTGYLAGLSACEKRF